MGVTIDVPPGVLKAARVEWEAAAEDLDRGWRRLHKTSTGQMSSEVATALETFRENWVDELKVAQTKAEGFSDALEVTDGDLVITDQAEAETLRDLLAWQYRNAAIKDT